MEGVPCARIERRLVSEDGGTSTVEDSKRRIKSAGRQVSRTSETSDVGGVIYCRDCLNLSTLHIREDP